MNQISVREFQLHANDYLDKLPIELTRYGIPMARVIAIGVNTLPKDKLIEKANSGAKYFIEHFGEVKQIKMCKHGAAIGNCKHGCTK